VLVYVNDQSDFGNLATEADNGYGHGLVMAYNNASTTSSRYNPRNANIVSLEEYMGFTQFVNKNTGAAAALTDGNGSDKTFYLAEKGSPAAQQACNFPVGSAGTGWVLPSTAQWIAILCGPNSLGGGKMHNGTGGMPVVLEYDGNHPFTRINSYIRTASRYTTLGTSDSFWSSSAYNAKVGIYVTGTNPLRLTWYNWSQYAFVRPVFAY